MVMEVIEVGRELRRKEEKKNKSNNIKKKEELDTSIKGITVLKVVGAIILILLVLYYVLAVFVTKELDVSGGNEGTNDTGTQTSSVANRILASQIFEQSEEEYYVYFYDFTDEDKSIASAISGKSDMKIYRVDTNSGLNQNYVTEESGNASVTGLENLKVKNPTFIKISGDQVVDYYEGSNVIVNYLNQ